MRVSPRRLLVSAAVVVGLFVPAAPVATATSDGGGASSHKRTLLTQMNDRTLFTRPSPVSGGPLSLLAAERDADRVVIAVKVRPGANDAVAVAAVAGAARSQGGRQRHSLRQLDTVTVEVPKGEAKAFSARMRGRVDVAKVDLVPRRSLSYVPNDPKFTTAQAPYLNAVTAPAAWAVHRGVPGVKIAVVDSGVDVNHPDLTGRVAGSYNAVTGSADVTDALGHGTFVAGVAVATGNNSIGIAGAAFGASVLAVKVANADGGIWADSVANGVIWAADHGAKIINLSLGSDQSAPVERDAIAYAIGNGVLVVAAAGNSASTALSYPAAYPGVVAVGATDVATGGRASFSQHGSWVTVAAPGVNITGTTPIGGSEFFPSTSGYTVANGTSFSSPIVAAEAALLWSARPTVSAADIRQAVVKSSHGYSNLGLGTGQVDFRAAFDRLRPTSVPTLTRPTNGTTVTGVVQLAATSTALKVRFLINGTPLGGPIPTRAGAASIAWPSWGWANGPLTVRAVDCSIDGFCNTLGAQVGVTLANVAPAVTSPRASQKLSGAATFAATSRGGGVAFFIDGVYRSFDAVAPYVTYPKNSLIDGPHAVRAVSCSTSGTKCAGPASPSVHFTSKSLHPRITAVSPSVFSPNGDGRYDTTRATYYLPDTQYVRFQVRNAAGTIVRGPSSLGTLGAGTRTLTWNGLLNSGVRARNGAYTLELLTTRGTATGTLSGFAVARVRAETTAPTVWSVTGSGATFYSYPDSYKDSFAPRFSLSERATVGLTVHTRGGTLVRNHVVARVAGSTSIVWDGKNTAGGRVAAGTYYWTLTAQDPAGNRRTSARYGVVVSGKRLVTKTATLSRRGAQYHLAGGSAACTWASSSASDFAPYGVWLANDCGSATFEIAASTYRFTLPAAQSYTSLRAVTYGNSIYAPSTLGAAFTRWATGTHTFTPEISVGSTNAWRTFGTVAPTGVVNGSRQVETTVYVPNDNPPNDYDISSVSLAVTYKALV